MPKQGRFSRRLKWLTMSKVFYKLTKMASVRKWSVKCVTANYVERLERKPNRKLKSMQLFSIRSISYLWANFSSNFDWIGKTDIVCSRRKPLTLKMLLDQLICITPKKVYFTDRSIGYYLYISLYIFGFSLVVWRWLFFTLLKLI